MFDLDSYLKEQAARVNRELDQLLPKAEAMPAVLHQAMRYSVFAGGKRLRPILFSAAVEAVGGISEPLLPFACALEMIHTYSLIHDDLPAMDNDDFRRGLPTCHKKFGEAQAILAGDCLLTYAFNLMLQVRSAGVPSDLLLTAIDQVAWSAGIKGMIVGQVLDMAAEEGEVSLPELQLIHAYKTGALFKAALCSGGILGGADAGQLAALTTFAEEFGLAFQITDDILDVVGDEQKLGKPVGSDAKNHKTTYPTLVGLAKSRELAKEAAGKAVASLQNFGDQAEPLRQLAQKVVAREY